MLHVSSRVTRSGLTVFARSFPQLETVGIAFGVRFGSVDEAPNINGAAHFLEHMMFKGTKTRTWKDIDDQLRELGAYHNAFTDHESTVYFIRVYRGYFEKALDILSDMIENSTLPKEEFEKERGPIINENLMRHDNPRFMMTDYIPRVLYKKHPARMSVGGDNDKTIKNIKRTDLLRIYRRYYTPKNSALAIYGGVGTDIAFKAVEKYFGGFSGVYVKPERRIAKEPQERETITLARRGIKQMRIGIGFKCSEYRKDNNDEFLSFLVLEKYLHNRLFEELRQKRGLAYDPAAVYNPYSTFGFIAAAAGAEPSKLGEVRDVILGEFKKLEDGNIDKEEFERAKKALGIQYIIEREETSDMAIEIVISHIMYSGVRLIEKMPETIARVDIGKAKMYCKKYIDTGKYGMVLLRPG